MKLIISISILIFLSGCSGQEEYDPLIAFICSMTFGTVFVYFLLRKNN